MADEPAPVSGQNLLAGSGCDGDGGVVSRAQSVYYSDALADEIIRRITDGQTLRDVCRLAHMPTWGTVYDWIDARPEFEARFVRARARGHDAIAAEALRIADTPEIGEETTVRANGETEIRRGDMLGHRKLQIETRLKLLAKWDKRYGDRMALGGSDELPPIKTSRPLSDLTIDEIRAALAKLGG